MERGHGERPSSVLHGAAHGRALGAQRDGRALWAAGVTAGLPLACCPAFPTWSSPRLPLLQQTSGPELGRPPQGRGPSGGAELPGGGREVGTWRLWEARQG